MSGRTFIAAAALLTLLVPGIAAGQSVCVECKEPERTYSCSVKDSERVQKIQGAARALEYLCISEIAHSGKHLSCRVGTGYSGPCIGQTFEIDVARLGSDQVVVGRPDASGAVVPPAAGSPQPEPARKGPPQTLEELARNTVSKSKEQISAADQSVRKAGDAVGGTLKKTWDCLASLFNRC